MTIDEFMRDISPKMKQGWVVMGSSRQWYFFKTLPFQDMQCKVWFSSCLPDNLDMFDIEPVDYWTQSLRKVGCDD